MPIPDALALVPRRELESAATWSVSGILTGTSSAEHPTGNEGTVSLTNTGAVDLVIKVASEHTWLTLLAPAFAEDGALEHLAAGDSVDVTVGFDGRGMLKEFTTDVLVLAIKDDGYPDCYVSSLESKLL